MEQHCEKYLNKNKTKGQKKEKEKKKKEKNCFFLWRGSESHWQSTLA
jgi:hypothetical protein